MEPVKKITLLRLPPAVEEALREQLGFFRGIAVLADGAAADLIVTPKEGAEQEFPGRPVFSLSFAAPLRLGVVLRQIGRMLAQPVLYIDDIVIGVSVFRPHEKILQPRDGAEIPLTDREVDILAYLARHAGQTVRREELLKNVWQYQEGVDTHTLETHIYRLRQKMETSPENPEFLRTVEGGYSLHLSSAEV